MFWLRRAYNPGSPRGGVDMNTPSYGSESHRRSASSDGFSPSSRWLFPSIEQMRLAVQLSLLWMSPSKPLRIPVLFTCTSLARSTFRKYLPFFTAMWPLSL